MPKRFRAGASKRSVKRAKNFINYASKRAVARRAPTFRRRVSLDYHAFSRYQESFDITTTAVSEGKNFWFSLTDVINYNEFTAMFDMYKIHKIVFKMQLVTNPDAATLTNSQNTSIGNSLNWYPKLWYIRDYDSGATETLSTIKERVGAKFFIMRPNKEVSIVLKPMVAVQTYKTLASAGYGAKRMWVDCSDADVPHYGLKTVIDSLGIDPVDTTGFKIRCDVKFYLGFKGVR